jgi:hypothetical protein
MTAAYTWPSTLPQKALAAGFQESQGVNALSAPMDAGPAKMRYVSQRPDMVPFGMLLNDTQLDALETFVKTTIKGISRFNVPHPRTQQVVEARLIPSGDGEFYTIAHVGPRLWRVTLQLQILP